MEWTSIDSLLGLDHAAWLRDCEDDVGADRVRFRYLILVGLCPLVGRSRSAGAHLEMVTEFGAQSLPRTATSSRRQVESIFGTPVEFFGAYPFCNITFASDSVAGLATFSGSKADEAMDTLLPRFLADETAVGVLLTDERGFVQGYSAVVRGDSGRVFRFDLPENVEVPDLEAAMQAIADLLLTR